uniref:Homeobox transcription n=1 Tax=Mycena chlorophos TaxID=658473 RepID=A0ABQ0L6W5_MYCCL|nr:homeobox transcription [Mycena chlorophos]
MPATPPPTDEQRAEARAANGDADHKDDERKEDVAEAEKNADSPKEGAAKGVNGVNGAEESTVSPTDNVLKIKGRPAPDPLPPAAQPPPHMVPQHPMYAAYPPGAAPWGYRPDQPWLPTSDARQQPPPHGYALYPADADHQSVRLPSIQALLTEPFNPPPRGPVYQDGAPWPQQPPPQLPVQQLPPHMLPQQPQPMPIAMPPAQPVPERYPPLVAPLPLDDSRARSPQAMPQRKRGRLPKETTDFLKAWLHSHSAHPYPSEIEKKQMCHATGLSMSQVSNWMINGRRRILGPSYLSTSRSNPHGGAPPVALSNSPPMNNMNNAPVLLTQPPTLMLRTPQGGPTRGP